MRQRIAALVAGCIALACGHPRAASVAPSASVLLPGSQDIATEHFRDTVVNYHFVRLAAQSDSIKGTLPPERDATVGTSYEGVPAILTVETTVTGQGKPYIDSALVWRKGLAPIWETYHLGTTVTKLAFDGRQVHRTVISPDSAPRTVDHQYDVRVFHFAELEQLIRSVPLRAGYHVIVPLYSEGDDALEMDTIQVLGRSAKGAWDVRFSDKVIIAHYAIDGTTRTILSHAIARHAGGDHFLAVWEP